LCRPESGLNDMLNQIEIAYQYAISHDRCVIVDTNHVSSKHFRDDFEHYFTSTDDRLILSLNTYNAELNELDVYPTFLTGKVDNYHIEFSQNYGCWVETKSKMPILFDFGKDYTETVLVQQHFGGGVRSINALQKLRIKSWLAKMLKDRINSIGGAYHAVHVRNTDLKTDYVTAIESLKKLNINRLFVATDSAEVLNAFKIEFGNQLISFSDIQPEVNLNSNGSLHFENNNPRKNNTNAILDLLTLAMAETLHMVELHGCTWAKYSGFSVLAMLLKSNPNTLKDLIEVEESGI